MPPARSPSSAPSSSPNGPPCDPRPPAPATAGRPCRCIPTPTPTPSSRLHQSRLMESIADAADGLDKVGGVAQLLPQALDVDVDRPLQDHRVLADGGIHQLEPREGTPRLAQEHLQEAELGRGQGQ